MIHGGHYSHKRHRQEHFCVTMVQFAATADVAIYIVSRMAGFHVMRFGGDHV